MRKISIQWKISLLAGACLLLSTAALTGIAIYGATHTNQMVIRQTSDELKSNAELNLAQQAETQSSRVVNYLNDAVIRSQMVVQALQFQKSFAEDNLLSSEVLRGAINQTMRSAVEHADHVLAGYVVYRPDALDAEDANYVGSTNLGANDSGRVAFSWQRNAKGELQLATFAEQALAAKNTDANGIAATEWWQCSQRTQQSCLLDPRRDGANRLITSVTYPILEGKELKGIAGLDIELAQLQKLVVEMDQQMFGGAGEVLLLSQNGIVAGSTQPGVQVGSRLSAQAQEMQQALQALRQQGQRQTQWQDDKLRVLMPIRLQGSQHSWALILTMPAAPVLQHANQLADHLATKLTTTSLQLLVSALVIGGLGLLIFWFVARQISTPLRHVAERLRDIAQGEGDLTQRLSLQRGDELGALANWFNAFLDKIHGTVRE